MSQTFFFLEKVFYLSAFSYFSVHQTAKGSSKYYVEPDNSKVEH